jgi:ABC-type Fe3+/spermidine/putrescine transport system ATPase subunit
LRDIEFTAEPGNVVGILGEQFSGKSTLLKVLSGELSASLGRFGFIDSVASSLRMPKSVKLIEIPQFRGKSLSQKLGLTPFRQGKSDISELLDVLKSKHELLLIDGGFGMLDDDDRERFATHLRKWCFESGAVAIIATRNFEDIALMCDRAVIIDGTFVVQSGSPRELYQNPRTVKAAILTGAVNLIAARRKSSTKADNPVFHLIDHPMEVIARQTANSDLGPINQNVNLMIRPESVSISFGASFPEDNLLKGRIEGIDFRGPFTFLNLDCSGLKIRANVPKVVGLEVGEECMIGLPPDRIHVLKS